GSAWRSPLLVLAANVGWPGRAFKTSARANSMPGAALSLGAARGDKARAGISLRLAGRDSLPETRRQGSRKPPRPWSPSAMSQAETSPPAAAPDQSSVRPVLGEIASAKRDGPFAAASWGRFDASARLLPIFHNESANCRGGYGRSGDIYSIYQEMEDKDGHLFAALQTRKRGVLARSRRLFPAPAEAPGSPGDNSLGDRERALAVCQRALDGLPNFQGALAALLDSLAKGMSALEVMWKIAPDGAV